MESFADRKLTANLQSGIKTLQKALRARRQLQTRPPIGKVICSTMQVRNNTHCTDIKPEKCGWDHDHFLLDIALIQLSTHDPPSNQAPLLRQRHPTLLSNDVRVEFQGITQQQYGMKVFKCGSESHNRSGMLSGLCWFRHKDLGYYEAWSIAPLGEERRHFAVRGDSAAAVTTQSGVELVGQLHGALVDQAGEQIVYMNPTEPITAFIEAQNPGSTLNPSINT
ncbi:MAG: hypothetical protein Q9184_007028, partial [Pyrenodesmia sp. 2 TL-2023]